MKGSKTVYSEGRLRKGVVKNTKIGAFIFVKMGEFFSSKIEKNA